MLIAVGVSHKTAPLEVREKAAFTQSEAVRFESAALRAGAQGVFVLSTCNRSEVFASVPDLGTANAIAGLYARRIGNRMQSVATECSRLRLGSEALRYLFRIAAGLESQVVGENEILGQVKTAFASAQAAGSTNRELNIAVQAAVTCAKRIKTSLPRTDASVASRAVAFLEERIGVEGKRILVIGRGLVARRVAELLRDKGSSVVVANRTGAEGVIPFERRYDAMAGCDAVVSATSSPHLVVRAKEVRLQPRTEKEVRFMPKLFIDLASPRDIDPALPDVFNLDSLSGADATDGWLPQAEAMIEKSVAEAIAKIECNRGQTFAIGTRASRLALVQAQYVLSRLSEAYPECRFTIKTISTRGDRDRSRSIAAIGDSALFTRDIEDALLAGTIDLAVHSMKDLPAVLPEGLILADAWEREDPRDVLVLKNARSFAELPSGAVVATGSVRRTALLKAVRPDIEYVDIRGNVDTRLRKLFAPEDGEPQLDGLCLAAAGLKRLGRADSITEYLDPKVVVPAPCQGTLAIELRQGDARLLEMVNALADRKSAIAARTERAFLRATGGDCHEVIGALAQVTDDGEIALDCVYRERRATLHGRTVEEVLAKWEKGGAASAAQKWER